MKKEDWKAPVYKVERSNPLAARNLPSRREPPEMSLLRRRNHRASHHDGNHAPGSAGPTRPAQSCWWAGPLQGARLNRRTPCTSGRYGPSSQHAAPVAADTCFSLFSSSRLTSVLCYARCCREVKTRLERIPKNIVAIVANTNPQSACGEQKNVSAGLEKRPTDPPQSAPISQPTRGPQCERKTWGTLAECSPQDHRIGLVPVGCRACAHQNRSELGAGVGS
jgi:hypothetical protein